MFKKILLGFGFAGLLVVAACSTASAQSVTQGFVPGEDGLQNGMIVRLNGKDKTTAKIVALSQENEQQMLGIIVASSDSPVALADPNAKQQVFIARNGQYAVLVSTQNGPIKAGDSIVISSIKGVGMKADSKHQAILGKALQNFSEGANANSSLTLNSGQSKTKVAIGRILVDVGITRNPGYSGDAIANVPQWLAKAARAVSGRPITALRLYACLAILVVAFFVAGTVLFAGARSGMNAVGRNPFAKKTIMKSMVTVVMMAIIIVTVGIIAVYLLLKV
ncbi:MAG TPA: hypothetical protein VLE73_04145 [Candidatus Saccharimonadales bacterium]|nr:hypothetical protein [Candidatus Saccharimonadales bacterium]